MAVLAAFREYSILILFSSGLMLFVALGLFLWTSRSRRLDNVSSVNLQNTAWPDLGFAISSHERFSDTAFAITAHVVERLGADFSAMYRLYDDYLEVIALFNLPKQFLGYRLPLGSGYVGAVAESSPKLASDYSISTYDADLPMAKSMFSTAIAIPIHHDDTVYVVLAAKGLHGIPFDNKDVQRFSVMIPQIMVLIANSTLFERQAILTQDLLDAKGQLEAVLTSTQNPVIAVDRSLRPIFTNPAAISLADLLSEDAERSYIAELSDAKAVTEHPLQHNLIRRYLPDSPKKFIKALRNDGQFSYEIEMGELTYNCHVTSLGQPESAVGWVAILNDITGLKELDRFKSQMVRMTSHDLKNPLFAAMSYLDLLQDELDSLGLSEQTQSYTETIMHQFARMNRTISSILDLERVESGLNTQEVCEIYPIVCRVIDEWRDQFVVNNLALEVSTTSNLPSVIGDRKHLAQMFTNLLENAIKFTPSGGQITVELSGGQHGVLMSVTDTGIGIPAELQDRVFERFFRAQQAGAEHIGGSGLGLSLVRSIVKLHGGRVSLTSELNQGTTVMVWLPEYSGE